ncbi:GNAT family N-acetyltransferase [Lysobacter zhanggongensis]|jgi:ribosomal protein S18 acetylase RimI-like enzyme|uniref:GNAT family N-acetyltransferase n=1 Tax=Lysobacter zhanggongensis TaxID=1774951 RepID=A0ABU7YLR3_9GAMM
MRASELDNPFWASLDTCHRDLALRHGDVARFPPAYAPFLGVPGEEGADAADIAVALQALVEPGETVYLLGVGPPPLDAGWDLTAHLPLSQMVCTRPVPGIEGPAIIELGPTHRADVLALTALVYPHYFRARTMELGRYFGIYQDGRLAAMIGERLGTDTAREISAVCTHPDFGGRGYARRLLAMLVNDNLARGRTPFLHVSQENARAGRLYEHVGYRVRRRLPFWSLRRV